LGTKQASGVLQDETTEILEIRRRQRDDLVVFEKLVEAFGAAKAAAESGEKGKKKGQSRRGYPGGGGAGGCWTKNRLNPIWVSRRISG
jgi:hypothetical protein